MQRITIFGRKGCGFCTRAKQLCEMKNLEHRYIDIQEEGITKEDLEKTVGKPVDTVHRSSTARNIWGGFTEFAAFVDQHEASA